MISSPTQEVTGFLEVQIIGGKLLHSKKNGDGYVDNDAKMQRILNGIQEYLDGIQESLDSKK